MKKMISLSIMLFVLVGLACSQPFDTLRMMHYNILSYRTTNGLCNASNNNPDAKDAGIATIIQHEDPDIITFNEVGAGTNNIFALWNGALNTGGIDKYETVNNFNTNSNLGNILFYNGDKLGFLDQGTIEEAANGNQLVRLIDVYQLYYKDPKLATTTNADTVKLYVFVAHLKAGSGSSNETQRNQAANAIISYISTNNLQSANVILAGDLNVYDGDEPAFETLTTNGDASLEFHDPVNLVGPWNNNSSYGLVHTQSTRSSNTNGGCYSGGGMDDRFDFILANSAVMDATNGMSYEPFSYKILGQDGNRLNGTVSSPANFAAPAPVIDALYNTSDHLPVLMNLLVQQLTTTSIRELKPVPARVQQPITDVLRIFIEDRQDAQLEVYTALGNLVHQATLQPGSNSLSLGLKPGIYLLRITAKNRSQTVIKSIQI